ncbi:MAG: hypothetical protein QHH15_04340, partial [Candidatus Thermoplasmatota archaeon]|nr:hypothetical protein [Candidatus Thermoplasmatota archaeon]
FSPDSGENLKPSDGEIIVNVSVLAPDKKSRTFEGIIIVINQDNPVDLDFVNVYLKTPRSINPGFSFFNFLNNQKFFSLFLKLFYKS